MLAVDQSLMKIQILIGVLGISKKKKLITILGNFLRYIFLA